MKKAAVKKDNGRLVKTAHTPARPSGAVRGKYYRQVMDGANLVVIDPDLFALFPDGESVNRALRLLADTARAATRGKPRSGR